MKIILSNGTSSNWFLKYPKIQIYGFRNPAQLHFEFFWKDYWKALTILI